MRVKEYKDGLTEEIMHKKYRWIFMAVIRNAIIGEKDDELIWYDGEWFEGLWYNSVPKGKRWKNGSRYNLGGKWLAGIWYRGYVVPDGVCAYAVINRNRM